jgi:hypothetical protein
MTCQLSTRVRAHRLFRMSVPLVSINLHTALSAFDLLFEKEKVSLR